MKKNVIFMLFLLMFSALSASEGGSGGSIVHEMTTLVFQIGIIIFAARLGGILSEKIGFPSVIGELTAGIIIGPYLLGSISIPGFEHGLFFIQAGATFPISTELYGIATIASIILLFIAGLETDIDLFLKYSLTGSIVGIGGIAASFFIGSYTAMFMMDLSFMDPRSLFLGVMSTATSVGITARILSERRNMDSPEGVTILAGAVIDDVLGIIMLAIVLGISALMMSGVEGNVPWGNVGLIAFKAIGVWLGFTVAGLVFARKISGFLKMFKNKYIITIISFGLALFMAGIFEKAGLAMIIGAYVMGLSLSKTDLSFVIQDTLHPLQSFFVPVFFTVMGMLVNVGALMSADVLIFGIVYSVGAIFAKMVGCGLPALFLNFNKLGAIRIGLGMVPRGEVALIIAGIGLSYGILDEKIFGVAIMMTLLTTIPAPPLLNIYLKKRERGTRKVCRSHEIITTSYKLPSKDHSELMVSYITHYFRQKGFFINKLVLDTTIYQIRKETVFIKLFYHPVQLIFKTSKADSAYVRTVVSESFLKLFETIDTLKSIPPRNLKEDIGHKIRLKREYDIVNILDHACIEMELKGRNKEEIVMELIYLLEKNGKIRDRKKAYREVMAREKIMSTGMHNGIAVPHARSDQVKSVELALGIKRGGIDFDSFDGNPSKVFLLMISAHDDSGRHGEVLAEIAEFFETKEAIEQLTSITLKNEIMDFFREK